MVAGRNGVVAGTSGVVAGRSGVVAGTTGAFVGSGAVAGRWIGAMADRSRALVDRDATAAARSAEDIT